MLSLPDHFKPGENTDIDDAVAAALTHSYCSLDIERLIQSMSARADALPYRDLARHLEHPSTWVGVKLGVDGSVSYATATDPADPTEATVTALARLAVLGAYACIDPTVTDDDHDRAIAVLDRVRAAIAAAITDITT